ncbi:CotH kinase family protein [Mucilaginibacter myungsuensis]|uniref:CotH kinase family protein n=1 Tax=Mucilaginibacter myungsuensis TaxID=649104 RepID=A0A929PX15_9SPHI|nr:CotH kinase family protein [Mucilaginibacter myungsuensis]MBE9661762.1 CotH kinase family protein [Mucilaginibacter myungsuensis]MDN3599804.1 CotH kinase family protein [Mucilaginibacter myungsuensis]
MKKNCLLVLLLVITVWGCKKSTSIVPEPGGGGGSISAAAITSAKLEVKYNAGKIATDVLFTIDEANNQLLAVLPDVNAVKKLAVTFTTRTPGTLIKVVDTLLISGTTVTDYSLPVTYKVQTPQGVTRDYKVMVKVFTGIPIINITSSGAITSKETYVNGTVSVNGNGEFESKSPATMRIRGRGNSSWSLFPKKPYRIKLDNKSSMLGMPSAKDWVLLANYNDKTLMRNRVALELARRLGSDFAPESRFVEVFLNGQYQGNYLMTAQVEVNTARVNITEMTASSTDITGGYLLELDYRLDAPNWFRTTKDLPVAIKSPDEKATPAQLAYIKKYFQDTEDAIFSSNWGDPVNGYAKFINSDSFVNWLLTMETVKNQDARDFSSVFFFKDKGAKMGMGPVWDFDLSSGNIDSTIAKNPENWYVRDGTWFLRLAQDYNFNIKVRNRWTAMRATAVEQIFRDIDYNEKYLALSQKKNFEKWPILDKYIWRNAVVTGAYDKEVDYMRTFLKTRVAWIDKNIMQF